MKLGNPIIQNVKALSLDEASPPWYARPILRRVLYRDPATGGLHLVIRYPRGLNAPTHRHNCAHTMFILDGEMVINGNNYGPGTYAHFPAGELMVHTTPPDKECTFLMIFHSSPEFMVEGGPTYKIT